MSGIVAYRRQSSVFEIVVIPSMYCLQSSTKQGYSSNCLFRMPAVSD